MPSVAPYYYCIQASLAPSHLPNASSDILLEIRDLMTLHSYLEIKAL